MPTPGQVINRVYRLETKLAEGGMGTVWRARHEFLGRVCAVKFLRPGYDPADGSLRTERFLREAKLLASIQSRFVVNLFDFGSCEDGELYMVMELLHGKTLAERLVARPAMSLGEAARAIGLSLAGLEAVHEAGIVHRDLKPDNIFLFEDADGFFPKLIDFGISRPAGRQGRTRALTRMGLTMGTPHFMAPEQVRGDADLDGRADIYAMGVLLFKAATGRFPYLADNVFDLMVKVVSEAPPRADELRPAIGARMADVIARALARDRQQRFQNALEMRAALAVAGTTFPPELMSLWELPEETNDSVPELIPTEADEDLSGRVLSQAEQAETPPEAIPGTLAMASGYLTR